MPTIQRTLSMSVTTAVAVLMLGCASSAPSTSQAPPETKELKPPTSKAPTDESDHGQGGGSGSGAGSGDGSGESAGQTTGGGAGEAPSGDASTSAGDGAPGDASGDASGGAIPEGGPTTDAEAAAALDRELSGAIEEFDRRMREERQRLAEEAESAERASSQRAGGGGPRPGSPGGAGAESATGGTTDPRGGSGDSTESGEEAGSVGGSGPGAAASDRVPADVGDGSDDDIVARQLREAAMAEEDPALREKLWDEYRRYKASVGGSARDDQ